MEANTKNLPEAPARQVKSLAEMNVHWGTIDRMMNNLSLSMDSTSRAYFNETMLTDDTLKGQAEEETKSQKQPSNSNGSMMWVGLLVAGITWFVSYQYLQNHMWFWVAGLLAIIPAWIGGTIGMSFGNSIDRKDQQGIDDRNAQIVQRSLDRKIDARSKRMADLKAEMEKHTRNLEMFTKMVNALKEMQARDQQDYLTAAAPDGNVSANEQEGDETNLPKISLSFDAASQYFRPDDNSYAGGKPPLKCVDVYRIAPPMIPHHNVGEITEKGFLVYHHNVNDLDAALIEFVDTTANRGSSYWYYFVLTFWEHQFSRDEKKPIGEQSSVAVVEFQSVAKSVDYKVPMQANIVRETDRKIKEGNAVLKGKMHEKKLAEKMAQFTEDEGEGDLADQIIARKLNRSGGNVQEGIEKITKSLKEAGASDEDIEEAIEEFIQKSSR